MRIKSKSKPTCAFAGFHRRSLICIMKKLVPLFLSCLIAGSRCAGQGTGEAEVFLNNYDANQPILLVNGATTQLAPFLTRVQVLARPVGSQAAFRVMENDGLHISTFLTGQGPDAGL